jgi:hypothetical protein
MGRMGRYVTAVALCLGMVAPAQAQIFTPTFMSPQRLDEMGLYLNQGPGSLSVEGLWRRNLGDFDLGVRGGVAGLGGVTLLVGAEFRTPYLLPEVPLQTAFTGGVQAAIGDGGAAGVQGGLTIGLPVAAPDFTLVPYIHPRLAILSPFGADGVQIDPLADLGFDFIVQPNLVIRFAIGLGRGASDWGLGVSWR